MSNKKKSPSSIALWLGPVLLGVSILVSMCLVVVLIQVTSTVNNLSLSAQNALELSAQTALDAQTALEYGQSDQTLKSILTEIESTLTEIESILTEINLQSKSATNTLAIGMILVVVLSIILIVAIIDRIWILIKFRAIREDYRILRERYNVLLGSKRIIDAELRSAQEKLSS